MTDDLREKVDATLQDWQAHGCRDKARYAGAILALTEANARERLRQEFIDGSEWGDDAEAEAARRYP